MFKNLAQIQNPEGFTTYGRFRIFYHKLVSSKHLIQAEDGQYALAKDGQFASKLVVNLLLCTQNQVLLKVSPYVQILSFQLKINSILDNIG